MYNPKDFNINDIIESVYSVNLYKVIEPYKKGMAKLKNVDTLMIENWNSCNNPHFVKAESQLKLNLQNK